jgi:AcrR family transcriptional regulator
MDVAHHQGRPRTVHEQRSRRTREKLADAAIDCLVESGYRGTSFVEVCRRAGLTRGAVHHHYRDIPALLLDALRRLNDTMINRVRPALRGDMGLEKRIDGAIDVLWSVFTSREFKAVVEIWVAQSHDPGLSRRIRSEMERYAANISEGFSHAFPELKRENDEALLMMRFAFLVVLGLGFHNATLGPAQTDPDRERMRHLLKKVVQREVGLMREGIEPGA